MDVIRRLTSFFACAAEACDAASSREVDIDGKLIIGVEGMGGEDGEDVRWEEDR